MAGFENVSLYQCSFCGFETAGLETLLKHDCLLYQNTIESAGSTSFEFIPDTQSASSSQGEKVVEKLDRWGESEVRMLMCSYADHKHLFEGKSTKKEIFKMIAESMNKNPNINVTGEQCMRKWSKLVTKLKEVNDHNNKSGNERKNWKYFDEMSLLVGKNNPSITPECTMESSAMHTTGSSRDNSSSSKESSLDDTEEDSETEFSVSSKEGKTNKRSRKRPKSRSSASEMLEFMRNYTEKKEKIEEEKLHILKEMKEEKQAFFNKFLEMMAQKK